MTNRGSRRVHQHVAGVLGQQRRDGLLVARVELDRAVAVARRGGVLGPGQVVVGDDQFGEPAAGGDPGKSRADPAGADKKNAHGVDLRPRARDRRDPR